jgi:hypothetical protein
VAEEKSWIRSSDAAFGTMFIHVISKSFQRSKPKLDFYFLFKKATQKCLKPFAHVQRIPI